MSISTDIKLGHVCNVVVFELWNQFAQIGQNNVNENEAIYELENEFDWTGFQVGRKLGQPLVLGIKTINELTMEEMKECRKILDIFVKNEPFEVQRQVLFDEIQAVLNDKMNKATNL